MGGKERSHCMITVYHGGVSRIVAPLASIGRKNLDFGQGFYVTRIKKQAQIWADRTGRQLLASPIVNEYQFDIDCAVQEYRYLKFEHYDAAWLQFIVACRGGYDPSAEYDCVEGGVANDRVIDTVEGFINGTVSEEYALQELSMHQPNNQICLLCQPLIDKYLHFIAIE